MKKLFFTLLLLAGFSLAYAQTTPQFKYKITYNSSLCLYEARAVLTGGTFNGGPATRLPAGMTFTIAVPAAYDDAFFTITSVTPTGLTWVEGAGFRAPAASPGWDYHPISHNGGGISNLVPTVAANGELVLFRFSVTGNQCGAGMRPYNNGGVAIGADPTSSEFLSAGDAGLNINNAFQFSSSSGAVDYYAGNLASSTTPPLPTVSASYSFNSSSTILNLSSTATAGSCAPISSYLWTRPLVPEPTFVPRTTASFTRSPYLLVYSGYYTVTVTDANGCTANNTVYVPIPLPIKLISFSGAANKCTAQLSWEIAQGEKDFQGFDVQYSVDGQHYGTVAHLDRSAYQDKYSYGYIQASGKGYYRLKITDLSGKESYSGTVVVSTECDNKEITISPNPTQALSTVSGIEAGDQVKVTDMLGNVIANYVSGGAKATIDLGIFPSGIYSVMISRGTEILKTAKITKL